MENSGSSRVFLDRLYNFVSSKTKLNKLKSLIKKKDINNALKLIDLKYHEYLKNIFYCIGSISDKKLALNKLKVDLNNKFEIDNITKIYTFFIKKYPNVNFFLDLTEVDDKNYHNGIRFTFFADDVRGEIMRGGRYLSNNGSNEESATGFTCYMDTILRASSNIEKKIKVMIPFDTSYINKKALIDKKYTIDTFFGSIKNIKKKAIEKKCQFYLNDNKLIKL